MPRPKRLLRRRLPPSVRPSVPGCASETSAPARSEVALQHRHGDLAVDRLRRRVGDEDVPVADAALREGLPLDAHRVDARPPQVEHPRQVDDVLDVILRRRLKAGRFRPFVRPLPVIHTTASQSSKENKRRT